MLFPCYRRQLWTAEGRLHAFTVTSAVLILTSIRKWEQSVMKNRSATELYLVVQNSGEKKKKKQFFCN